MLLNIIILAIFFTTIAYVITKKNKAAKGKYSNLINTPEFVKKTKQRNKALKKPINQEYIDDSVLLQSSNSTKNTGNIVASDEFLSFKVLTSKRLDNKQQETITEITQSFRKPHPLLLPLVQRSFEAQELFELIKADAEMTAKVINVVNSPLFGLQQPITNVNHAIIFLGVGKVKNIALQCAMQQGMTFNDKAQNEAYNKVWKASYLASSFCLLLAKEVGEQNAAELSTHCLLSYLGDMALLSYKPQFSSLYLDNLSLFERTKAFQESLGINVAVVGKFLAQKWQLPASIESGIEHSILSLTDTMKTNLLPDEDLRQLLLCYLACRLADLVAFNGLSKVPKIEEISFEALGIIEFYNTQKNIENSDYAEINSVITDPIFIKKINEIINKLG
jgi:HD-like signal output (HDOD) protein